MTSTSTGRQAEDAAAQSLKPLGFTVLGQNWRTRWCEIDIVATKNQTVYFIEVKYRETNGYGDGLDYITSKKLQQMQFAADLWCAKHNWVGDYQLAAIAVSGKNFTAGQLVLI